MASACRPFFEPHIPLQVPRPSSVSCGQLWPSAHLPARPSPPTRLAAPGAAAPRERVFLGERVGFPHQGRDQLPCELSKAFSPVEGNRRKESRRKSLGEPEFYSSRTSVKRGGGRPYRRLPRETSAFWLFQGERARPWLFQGEPAFSFSKKSEPDPGSWREQQTSFWRQSSTPPPDTFSFERETSPILLGSSARRTAAPRSLPATTAHPASLRHIE